MSDATRYRLLRADGTVEMAFLVPAGDNHSRAWQAVTTGVVPEHREWGSRESLV